MDTDVEFLKKQAAKCRMLAASVATPGTRTTLVGMANEYEQRAARVEAQQRRTLTKQNRSVPKFD